MSPAQASQGQAGSDSQMGVLWMIAAIFIFGLLIWFFAHAYLIQAFFTIKRFEIAMLQFFTVGLDSAKQFISSHPVQTVTFHQAVMIAKIIGVIAIAHCPFSISSFTKFAFMIGTSCGQFTTSESSKLFML